MSFHREEHEVQECAAVVTRTDDSSSVVPPPRGMEAAASAALVHNNNNNKASPQQRIIVKIVSAEYGPCEGRRLLTGEDVTDNPQSSVPYTRDVTPFLRALLLAQQIQQQQEQDNHHNHATTISRDQGPMEETEQQESQNGADHDTTIIRVSAVTQSGMKRAQIPVLDQMKGMNNCFGDPCPGVSKRLHISYIVAPDTKQWAASAEIHRTSFAEHEKVLLHRRRPWSSSAAASASATATATTTIAQNETEPMSTTTVLDTTIPSSTSTSKSNKILESSCRCRHWSLLTAVSEVVLPLVMEYLSIPERVHARLVCRGWRRIIRDFGVAVVIDNNDPQLLPGLTRPFLMGLLKHSYSSLQSLFLSGFEDLEKNDLHPSIPHLRKLRSLDVSRCVQLDDSTLELLAEHCSESLQVLYIKGLRKVTDSGILALCDKCSKLRVLEISNIPLTDLSGAAIGRKLTNLNAIYMRDDFRLTNVSITSITNNCHKLEQLTLWGCTRIREINFAPACREQLSLLNLWGCHGLDDGAAAALEGMVCLRTLIVSECHRLTDSFFASIAKSVPRLSHLHARYCKRLSDNGVLAIARQLENLYTLDLSFCTKVSPAAIQSLLEIRNESLAELRLQSCRNLSIGNTRDFRVRRGNEIEAGSTGRIIVNVLQSRGDLCCLSALDVRDCGGQPRDGAAYHGDDPFVRAMSTMDFQQRVPGFFNRPARWNPQIETRLVDQLLSETFCASRQ